MRFNRDVFQFIVLTTLLVVAGTASVEAMPVIKSRKAAAPVNLPKFNTTSGSGSQSQPATAFPALAAPVTVIPAIPMNGAAATKNDTSAASTSQQWITLHNNPETEAELERIENALMARKYPTDSIVSRLSRLEKLIYGQAHEQDSESVRLAALAKAVPQVIAQPEDDEQPLASSPARQAISDQQNDNSSSLPVASSIGPADPQLASKIDAIEIKMFNRTFSNETPDSRIGRMEKIEFNSTAPELSFDDRLDRVASVMRAHASSTQEKIGQTTGFPGVTSTQAVSSLTGLPQQITQGRPINSNNPNGPRKVHYGTPGSGGFSTYGPGTGGIMFGTGMGSSIAPQIMMMIFSALTRSPFP